MKIVEKKPVKPLKDIKEGDCFKIWGIYAIRICSERGSIKIASLDNGMTWTWAYDEMQEEMVVPVKARIKIE